MAVTSAQGFMGGAFGIEVRRGVRIRLLGGDEPVDDEITVSTHAWIEVPMSDACNSDTRPPSSRVGLPGGDPVAPDGQSLVVSGSVTPQSALTWSRSEPPNRTRSYTTAAVISSGDKVAPCDGISPSTGLFVAP